MFRTYMSLAREGRWECKSIFDLLPHPEESVRITLEHIRSEVISTPLEQLACLALLAKACHPKAVFEIGTFRGRTALNFALNVPEDCTVYTMDLPLDARSNAIEVANAADSRIIRESETGCDYRGTEIEHKIRQIYADSQTFDFSPFTASIDIVYIVAAHHYAAARRDSENALRIVRPGGYVLWDEFANYGDYNDVTRAVIDTVPAGRVWQIENTQLAVYRAPV
jgi:predicted O-methyltransferase YrrM